MANRILIADDSVTIQKAFALTFAAEDVIVVGARSSDEGLSKARQTPPDVVIADVAMPGASGYDLCERLRSEPATRSVPIFLLASVHHPVDEGRLRACGADGHTQKPFDSTSMIAFVRDALASARTTATARSGASAPPPDLRSIPTSSGGAARVANDAVVGRSGDDGDDYGEIAIEESGETQTSPPPSVSAQVTHLADDMVTPPPAVRPLAPLGRPAAPAASPSLPTFLAGSASAASGVPALFGAFAPPASLAGQSAARASGTAAPSASSSAPGALPAGLRPSLIPGLKPGAIPARGAPPGPTPAAAGAARPAAGLSPNAAPPASRPEVSARAPAPRAPSATPASARTLLGLPAVAAQPPPRPLGMPTRPSAPAASSATVSQSAAAGGATVSPFPSGPALSLGAPIPAGFDGTPRPSLFGPVGSVAASTVMSTVDQKMAAIASQGPEYAAIAKLSREIIERVVREVVPQLAEAIVREELAKRGRV